MKTLMTATLLTLLAACQSLPELEDDARYVRLAKVTDIREFTEIERKQAEIERKQARANRPSDPLVGVGFGFGLGVGSGGSFGGMSVGIGSTFGDRDRSCGRAHPPHIADGANRITVQPTGTTYLVEVMSYGQHKIGDCIKVLDSHPAEYPRFFELKPGESCE